MYIYIITYLSTTIRLTNTVHLSIDPHLIPPHSIPTQPLYFILQHICKQMSLFELVF